MSRRPPMTGTVRTRKGKLGPTYQARWRPPRDGRDSERRTRTTGLLDDGRSHRTMVKAYGPIAQAMKFAARRGYIVVNPCLNVALPPCAHPEYDEHTGYFIEDQAPPI